MKFFPKLFAAMAAVAAWLKVYFEIDTTETTAGDPPADVGRSPFAALTFAFALLLIAAASPPTVSTVLIIVAVLSIAAVLTWPIIRQSFGAGKTIDGLTQRRYGEGLPSLA